MNKLRIFFWSILLLLLQILVLNNINFSHTINPATGKPIAHTLASVTVVAPTCAEADAMAPALNVLGPIEGYNLAQKLDLAAYFIIRDGDQFTIKYTPQFQPYLVSL